MKRFLAKTFLFLSMALLLTNSLLHADTEDLIHFDLSLAGYSLGMTYDDALLERPLMFIQDTGPDHLEVEGNYFDAYAEQVYVEGIEMKLWVRFKNERLFKIIARFDPERSDDLAHIFNLTLGPNEDKSRSYRDREKNEIYQTVYFWNYPTAKLYLIRNSDNKKYATVGLTAKPAYAETFVAQE
jgi:hypothetical protein